MYVVNLFGEPASGKSTQAAALFSLLKMHNIKAELVTEFAKELTFEKRYSALSNQDYVTGNQLQRLLILNNKVDVVVTDSPLLTGLLYCDYGKCYEEHIVNMFNKFNNINYFLIRQYEYQFYGRNEDESEAHVIRNKLYNLINKIGVHYKEINSNVMGINTMLKNILNVFKKEVLYKIN